MKYNFKGGVLMPAGCARPVIPDDCMSEKILPEGFPSVVYMTGMWYFCSENPFGV